jgi:hypothetical protein
VHRSDGHPGPQLPDGDEHGGGHSVGCFGCAVAKRRREQEPPRLPFAPSFSPQPQPERAETLELPCPRLPSSLCKSSRAAALLHCCITSGLAALAAHACAWPNLAHKHTPTFISHVSLGPSTASTSRTSRPLSPHRREHATCKPPLTRAPCRRHEFRRAQPPRHV